MINEHVVIREYTNSITFVSIFMRIQMKRHVYPPKAESANNFAYYCGSGMNSGFI